MSKKVVRARYSVCEEFAIPDNIDLEDKSVVKAWSKMEYFTYIFN